MPLIYPSATPCTSNRNPGQRKHEGPEGSSRISVTFPRASEEFLCHQECLPGDKASKTRQTNRQKGRARAVHSGGTCRKKAKFWGVFFNLAQTQTPGGGKNKQQPDNLDGSSQGPIEKIPAGNVNCHKEHHDGKGNTGNNRHQTAYQVNTDWRWFVRLVGDDSCFICPPFVRTSSSTFM